jgi:glycosyltransferase involved in cell wall biosynthesis
MTGRGSRKTRGKAGNATWPVAPPPVVPSSEPARQPVLARIKVLHVITRFIDGAGGNTLVSVLGVDRRRFEPWVAGAPVGQLWIRAERAGIRTVKFPRFREVLSPIDDLVVLLDLVRLIRRERFTIVHTHSSKAGFLGRVAAWLCATPVVVHTIHGFSFHDFMSRRRRWAYIMLERLVRPITDGFIAVAPQVAREAVELRLAPPGAVSVIPSAVELDKIPNAADPSFRRELEIPLDVPLVGTVGRLDLQKAPLDFVRMAALVAKSHPRAHFIVVGEGALLDDARAEADRLGVEVTFTGRREDAATIAASFDVYVLSSLFEGLGRALTEALASGRPVAATAVNGVIDIIEPGSTGLLSAPRDPAALAANVVWLLDHPKAARRMGELGRARVRALFEPALMCTLIEETYAKLLGIPRSAGVPRFPELGRDPSQIESELHDDT